MRFTILAAGAFAVLAAAQTTVSPTVSATPAQASTAACLKKCDVGDVNCQSHCIAVPSPDKDQVIATTKCVAKCPQGDGTLAETTKYTNCIDACISGSFFVSSSGTPSPTDAPGSGSGDGSSDSSSSSSSGSDSGSTATQSAANSDSTAAATKTSSDSSSKTATDSANTATNTSDAAPALAASSFTMFGLFAAMFVL